MAPRAAEILAEVLVEVSGHLLASGPDAPTCYKMNQMGIDRMKLRDALATSVAAVTDLPKEDAAWEAALAGFSDALWGVVGAGADDFSSKDDPAWRLLSAEVFDLVRHLAP